MNAPKSELKRKDILDLLDLASDMSDQAIASILTKFCELNSRVRFASLWKLNHRSNSIAIYSRSRSDYAPQLGRNNEFIQEFLCSTSCTSVNAIVGTAEFREGKRQNFSIRRSKNYGIFHPEEVIKQYDLDEFIALPIDATHAPESSEVPRFFCLFYCPKNGSAADVADVDLDIVRRCLGKMIYNQFNESRWRKVERFTAFLSQHHDPESSDFLDQLRSLVPCEAVFEISYSKGQIQINGSPKNRFHISGKYAERVWKLELNNGANLLDQDRITPTKGCLVRTAIAYQTKNHEQSNRVIILYCNRITSCPLRTTGLEEFVDDFGFDDEMLVDAIGEHIRAFTLTKEERKRRDDVTRIIAHEIKQPLIDIRNSLAKFQYSPEKFGLRLTLDRMQSSVDLALLLAEINTELSDQRVLRLTVRRAASVRTKDLLTQMRLLMRGLCEDVGFKNDNIQVEIGQGCENLAIARSLLATIFLNTVSNSIKYSNRDFENAWCSFKMMFVTRSDPIWDQNKVSSKFRRNGLMMTTTDNGVGVPSNELERVFEKETRIRNPYAVSGLGLGLYHLRRTVESLDGRVWMASNDADSQKVLGFSTRIYTLLPESIAR